MTTLKKVGDGDKVNTPHIAKMLQEDMIEGLMKDYQNPKEDIIDEMTYPCGVCKGSGYDTEIKMPCTGCEGTGLDYKIVYGNKDGKLFAYTVQYGIDFFKEMCKAYREAESELSLSERANRLTVVRYKLPAVIDMELQARGFTPQDIRGGGERQEEICKIIQTEYPEFMCSNYRF